jgi:hypothetical protein
MLTYISCTISKSYSPKKKTTKPPVVTRLAPVPVYFQPLPSPLAVLLPPPATPSHRSNLVAANIVYCATVRIKSGRSKYCVLCNCQNQIWFKILCIVQLSESNLVAANIVYCATVRNGKMYVCCKYVLCEL